VTSPRRFRIRAYAKLNLTLRVGGVQADGYHPLQTVFQSLALHDTLEVTPRRGDFHLTCSDPLLPVDEGNLITRAARMLWSALGKTGRPDGVAVHLAKIVPVQAGLGGGSSDAAAALAALACLWRPRGAKVDLADLAACLGSDVPYFLLGGTALGLGRGEELYPLEDLPAYQVVLALPSFGVATSDAYRWFDQDRAPRLDLQPEPRRAVAGWHGRPLALTNDLEGPVSRRHPDIAAARRALEAAGAEAASMTGSGSAVFGLFAGEASAKRAARAVAEAGFVAMLTRTVDRRTCQRIHFSFASSSPRHA
jgi:4-diphosphocytidyl-2-C-methyl-D-erythritol kinase